MLSARHRLYVSNIVTEAPGVISIYMSGRDLHRLAVRSGQYFVWRFLTRDGWWRGHPFSISSAPNGDWLRITVKDLGDWSGALPELKVGTKVFIEGPYGVLTGARRSRPKVLLLAGGIGITPLRALFEALPARPRRHHAGVPSPSGGGCRLQVRDRCAGARPGRPGPLPVGRPRRRAGSAGSRSPASPRARHRRPRRLPVRACRDDAVDRTSLRRLGLPARQIHAERFAY